jgi:HEAT repeat protein
MMTALRTGYLLSAVSALWYGPRADAQGIEERMTAIRDGAVSFHFTARAGVCGDGEHFVRTGRHSYHGSWSNRRAMEPCVPGPVQVRLTIEEGEVHRVQYWVGALRDRSARDVGAVPAAEAARYLLGIAAAGNRSASAKAIMPAVLADSAVVWPALLAIAKDTDTRSRATRTDALFWLSRFATGAMAGRPNQPFIEDDEGESADDDEKKHAVFVLSQLPRGEGIPDLIQVARSNAGWRVRGHALFWLGQSGDPRVIPVLESVLRG